MRILVTGGCGFVGASISLALASRNPDWELIAFDNLRRRGSEVNLPRLRQAGVEFIHGDFREPGDLLGVSQIDALVECLGQPQCSSFASSSSSWTACAPDRLGRDAARIGSGG